MLGCVKIGTEEASVLVAFDPNVGAVNEGNVEFSVDLAKPNENAGGAGLVSSGFEIAIASELGGLVAKGNVSDVGVAENEKPPKRGTESLEVVVVVKVADVDSGKLNLTVRLTGSSVLI